jgi:hypothetical protein
MGAIVNLEGMGTTDSLRTSIEIKKSTHDFLASLGRKDESYDRLVLRLAKTAILFYKSNGRTATKTNGSNKRGR